MAVEWVFIVAMLYKDPRIGQKIDVSPVSSQEECLKLLGTANNKTRKWITDPAVDHWIVACAATDDLMALQTLQSERPPRK